MTSKGLTGRDLRSAVIFAALVYLAIRFVTQIVDIILIFSVTAIIVMVLDPAVSWLHRHKIPRQLSAAVLALTVIAAAVLLLYVVVPPAGKQVVDLSRQVPQFVERGRVWLENASVNYPAIMEMIPDGPTLDTKNIGALSKSVFTGASRVTASAAGILAGLFVAFITTIYVLANPSPLTDGFTRAFAPKHRDRVRAAGQRFGKQIKAWAFGTLVGMLFIFVLTWVGLAIIGIKQAFLFAVIAGLMEAVPIVGPIIAAVPPIIVALIQNPILALWVLALFVVIQQVEGNVIIPLIMSHQLSLHPVTVIFAVLVMGGLFGVVGVFLAAPAAVAAGILYHELYIRPREDDQPANTDSESGSATE